MIFISSYSRKKLLLKVLYTKEMHISNYVIQISFSCMLIVYRVFLDKTQITKLEHSL